MRVREATSTDASSVVPQGYKCTDVGIVPDDWQVMDLGEVAAMDVGYAFKSVWFRPDDGIRLLRGENVGYGRPDWSDTQRLPPKLAQAFDQYILRPGDIVIGMDRTFTKTGTKISLLEQADCPSLLVQRVGRFVPRMCTGRYLWALLSSEHFRKALKGEQKGMDIPHLSRFEILSMRVAIPLNETEQEAIGEVLSDVDELLAALEALIAKKRAIKQGAMQQLLTGKIRLPGFNSEWETKQLNDLARITMGQSPSSQFYNLRGDGVPLIQGNADIENRRTIERVWTSRANKKCGTGALLLTVRAPVGSVGIASKDACLGRGVCGLAALSDRGFLFHALVYAEPRWRILEQGSTFTSANSKQVGQFPVHIPNDEREQAAIASILSDIDAEIAALEARRDKTRAIKQGMMQQLLTGRIRLVKPQPAEAEA